MRTEASLRRILIVLSPGDHNSVDKTGDYSIGIYRLFVCALRPRLLLIVDVVSLSIAASIVVLADLRSIIPATFSVVLYSC